MAEKEITMWHLLRNLAKTQQLFWRKFVSFQKVSKIWHFTYQWIISLRPSNLLFSKLKEIGYEATGTIRKNKVERKCQLVPIKEMTKSSKQGDICAAVARNTDRNEEVKLVRLEDNNVVPVCSSVFGTRDVEAEAEAGSGSGGSGKFLWKRKRKLEAVNGYRFRFHLRCSTILALNVFLTQNKQLKHTITRVCEASCCRKYPLLNSQKFESTAVC